jgi:hypothetical protein
MGSGAVTRSGTVTKIANSGGQDVCLLLASGYVVCRLNNGVLGHGGAVWKKYGDGRVVDVEIGRNHTIILTRNGTLYCGGSNAWGQCVWNQNGGFFGFTVMNASYVLDVYDVETEVNDVGTDEDSELSRGDWLTAIFMGVFFSVIAVSGVVVCMVTSGRHHAFKRSSRTD